MDGTNGGPAGASGNATMPPLRLLAVIAAVTLAVAVVNSLTVLDDTAERLDPWEPWVWELTSATFWIAVALPLIRLTRALRPPALRWPLGVAALLLLSLPVCGVHIAWLAVSRSAVYAALGSHHMYDWSWPHVVYEWRKDLLTILTFAGLGVGSDRWAASLQPATLPVAPPFRLEVRDGNKRLWFAPDEIERVEAAGNYVELHSPRGPVLHRATLSAVEAELAEHGFARIHRSRLVRRNAVRAVVTTPSGDFEATLLSGAVVVGSRRFRAGLG